MNGLYETLDVICYRIDLQGNLPPYKVQCIGHSLLEVLRVSGRNMGGCCMGCGMVTFSDMACKLH